MKIRALTEEGVDQFRGYLAALRQGSTSDPPDHLLNDPQFSARIEGVVILECLISPQGRVSEVKVLRGVPLLEEAAVDAVRQWVYTPTLMDGVPVPVLMTVTVRFDLKESW